MPGWKVSVYTFVVCGDVHFCFCFLTKVWSFNMAHQALGGLGLLGLGLGRMAGRQGGHQGGYAAHPQARTSPLQDATSLLMKALGTLTFNELYYLGGLLGVPEGVYTPEMLTPNQGTMASRPVIFQQVIYIWLQYLQNLTWEDLVRALHRMGQINLAFHIWIEYMTSSQTNQGRILY